MSSSTDRSDCVPPLTASYLLTSRNRIGSMIEDVNALDNDYNITAYKEPTVQSLIYWAAALAGEAGEISNEVKKLIRDNVEADRWDCPLDASRLRSRLHKLMAEVVDLQIYSVELVDLIQRGTHGEIEFDKAWVEKHFMLIERFRNRDGRRAEGSE